MPRPRLLRPEIRRPPTRGLTWSRWDLIAWPFQVLTYTTIVFSVAHVLLTPFLYVATIALGLLSIALVPIAAARFMLHLVGCRIIWFYPSSIIYGGFQLLAQTDVALHNSIARPQVPLAFDANADDENLRLLEDGRHPRFVLRVRDDWSPSRGVQFVFYIFFVRMLLQIVVVQWLGYVAYSIEALVDIGTLVLFPRAPCTFSFFWGLDVPITCAEHPLGLVGCAVVLLTLFVRLRQPIVELLCWTTRYFCCESFLLLRG
ncbi:hypothetical protein ACHHYP_20616 [Achlya hypogyna]|uniref:Transmembrane protein n=1 Tax=Achlya hypogyna TaxID=1202772 RepID=A0A1V9YH71_ACHHY|nr:hypothetical protein ACHHYP_20616 [Achlya hypogyna]